MIAGSKTAQGVEAIVAPIFATNGRLVAPRVLARAGADSPPIEAPEQFDRDTRLLVLDQSRWSANPLGMLWPEMDAAFVTSGCKWRPRRVVIVAQMAIAVPSARRRRKKREGATSDRKGGV